MSTLDDLLDQQIDTEIKDVKYAPPAGKAKATLTEYGAARSVAGKDGQLYEILPAFFVVEGDQYNVLARKESLKVKYELWIAMTEDGKIDTGELPDGTAKNARMARFFKAFGRSTQGSRFNDLIGGQVTIGIKPEMDQNDEPTGFAKVQWVGSTK